MWNFRPGYINYMSVLFYNNELVFERNKKIGSHLYKKHTHMCKSLFMFACGFCPHLYPNQKELLNVKNQSFWHWHWHYNPWTGKIPRATEQRSLCAATTEPNYWAHMLQVLTSTRLNDSARMHIHQREEKFDLKNYFFLHSLSPSPLCLSACLSPLLPQHTHRHTYTHILLLQKPNNNKRKYLPNGFYERYLSPSTF